MAVNGWHLIRAGGLVRALERITRLSSPAAIIDVRVPMTGDCRPFRTSPLLGPAVRACRRNRNRAGNAHDRAALLLVFAGRPASWLSEEDALDSARRLGVVVHVVRVDSDSFLDRLATSTGGRTWSATSDRQLRELFTRALEEMRARYLLTYTPRGVTGPGWHEVRVRMKTGGADVTARPGYFAANQSTSP